MSIKNGFILGIAIFLIFILFRNQIKDDTLQIIFALAFVLSEVVIIFLVSKKLR